MTFHEPDVLFGTGKNEQRGAAAADVPARLDDLYEGVLQSFAKSEVDQKDLARVCARFLEEFFMIHPFHDGNGRVARLLLRVVANSTGRYYFDVLPEDAKSRRKYTQALAYAHRHCHVRSDQASDSGLTRDPYRYIARWLEKYICEYELTSIGEIEESEPTWLEERDLAEPPGWDDPSTLDDLPADDE